MANHAPGREAGRTDSKGSKFRRSGGHIFTCHAVFRGRFRPPSNLHLPPEPDTRKKRSVYCGSRIVIAGFIGKKLCGMMCTVFHSVDITGQSSVRGIW